jgi:lipopolysaccharide transport system permease protein
LWTHRELLGYLTWRDLAVRYKQTFFGVAWVLFQPLVTVLIFTLVFQRAMPTESALPYPVFVLTGMLPWLFLSASLGGAANSIFANQSLVTKVYFPRLLIPSGVVLATAVDFAIGCLLLGPIAWYYALGSSWTLLLVPLAVANLLAFTVGVGYWLAALTVAYRDLRPLIPTLLQLGLFATPAIYLPTGGHWLFAFNPIGWFIEAFRAAVVGASVGLLTLGVTTTLSLTLLTSGAWYFRKRESAFADLL